MKSLVSLTVLIAIMLLSSSSYSQENATDKKSADSLSALAELKDLLVNRELLAGKLKEVEGQTVETQTLLKKVKSRMDGLDSVLAKTVKRIEALQQKNKRTKSEEKDLKELTSFFDELGDKLSKSAKELEHIHKHNNETMIVIAEGKVLLAELDEKIAELKKITQQ